MFPGLQCNTYIARVRKSTSKQLARVRLAMCQIKNLSLMIISVIVTMIVQKLKAKTHVTPKSVPPKIGPAGPILAEKLVPPDHFCCQNRSGRTDFGSQNWSPFAKISPPTKVTVLASYSIATIYIIGCCIVTYVSHESTTKAIYVTTRFVTHDRF